MNTIGADNIASSGGHHTENKRARVTMAAVLIAVVMVGLLVADRLYHPEKFRIEQIKVRGQFVQITDAQLKAAVEYTLDGNYFSADLTEIENSLEAMPWVFSASVRRQWPSTLVVDVEEVRPIANWGENKWLNATGDLVDRQQHSTFLPQLGGPDSMQQQIWKSFRTWHGMFAAHGLALEKLEFDERELWYLTLSLTALALDRNNTPNISPDTLATGEPNQTAEVIMIVDNGDATARIQRLIDALNSQLIAEFPNMRSIDLRYPNGFAINWVRYSSTPRELVEAGQ